MKLKKVIWLMLGVMTWLQASAQFNPTNPPEPSQPPETYFLTVTATPEGAASSLSTGGKTEAGTRVSLYASPKTGFAFVRWEDDGGNMLSENSSFSFVMPAHDTSVIARFVYSPENPNEPDKPDNYAQLNLSVYPTSAGSVSGEGKYAVGSVHTVSTYPYSSYRFLNWTRDGEIISTQTSFSYEVREGSNNLVANYSYAPDSPDEPSATGNPHRLYLRVSPPESGYVSPSSGNTYQPGTTVTLDAYAYSNYTFVNWTTEDGEIISGTPHYDFTMPDARTGLVANFRYSPGNPDEPGSSSPRRNVIYGGRVNVSPGSEIFYDINLENIDAVTGIIVDIAMPAGFVADYSRAVVTGRTQSHTFSFRNVDDTTCRLQLIGTQPIAGGAGAVVRIPVRIPENAEQGSSAIVSMTHGVVVNADGSQTAVDAMDGILKISDELILPDSPDFVVTDVKSEKKSVMPGDAVTVTWKVANKGSMTAAGGWSETISLVNSANKRLALSTVYHDIKSLAVGEEVTRTATVGIPEVPGIDGELDIRVDLSPFVSSGEIEDMQINNSGQTSDKPLTLGKLLVLDIPENIPENYAGAIRCTLRRSGDWSEDEIFKVEKTPDDGRLVVPESVTVRRNQSEAHFTIFTRDNNVIDESSVVTIGVSGNGYDKVSADITIEDNEFADLEMKPSKDDITEGESFDIVITAPKPVTDTVVLNIVSDHPARFRHQSTVSIAPGESSATVTVNSVDDNEIQLTEPVEFTVSADNYQSNSCVIEIHDNDMPVMEMSFTPAEVSENAGPTAVTGILKRLTNTDSKVIIKLSDNSEKGDIHYPYNTLTMESGMESVEFPLGINDNSVADGDRRIEITAAVFVQSCGCSPTGTEAGLVTESLSVIDDDGPSLSLRSSGSSLVEGDADGITLTVTRNTDTSQACTVKLYADNEEGLSFPGEVTMAKGESSASVKVVASADDTPDNDRVVIFYAESRGHSKGICHVMLTDRTLPDAVVPGLTLSADEGKTNGKVTATATLRNDGVAPLQDATGISFYIGDAPEAIAVAYTPKALGPGESVSLSADVTLPSAVGSYEVYAVANERKSVREILYTNNISEKVRVNVLPSFRASVSTDKAAYLRGEKIVISGNITGNVNENDVVEIYLINDGLRQTVTAKADASGNFSASFSPYSAQIGHFIAGACYPGENLSAEMASFDVMGLSKQSKSAPTHETVVGETVKGCIRITNPTSVPVTGVKAVVVSKPDNTEFSVKCPPVIEAGQTFDMEYTVKGKSASATGQWDIIKFRVESEEGADCEGRVNLYCRNAKGALETDIQTINTTMIVDQPRDYRFSITNVGHGETGNITLSIPEWMKPVTPRQMPSLSANESADIVLRFVPTGKMQLNVPVTGQIGVNCENGDGLALEYSITPVSETTGTLVIDVCDEYTYYTEEAPHVEGAEVTVMHPVSYAVLARGVTDKNGLYSIELPEGYYAVKVTSPKHQSYSNILLVDPGKSTTEVINLGISGVEVTYTVVETEVEDVYRIETNYTYSTQVPVPVVVTTQDREVNGQDLAVGESTIINIIVTNEGLITALDFTIEDPVASDDWELTYLADQGPFDLPAKQSRILPLKVTRIGNSGVNKAKSKSPTSPISPCVASQEQHFKHHCDKELKESSYTYSVVLQICAHSAVINQLMSIMGGFSGGDGGGGNIYIPSGGSDSHYYTEHSDPVDKEPLFCDEEAVKCADKIVKELASNIPVIGDYISIFSDVVEKAADNVAGNGGESGGGNGGESGGGNGGGNGGNGGGEKKPVFSMKDAMDIAKEHGKSAIIGGLDPTDGGISGAETVDGIIKNCWKFIKRTYYSAKSATGSDTEYTTIDKIEAYGKQLENIQQLYKELYGDEIWYSENLEASVAFFDYAASLDEDAITFENLLPHKPAHVSEGALAAFLERISETNPDNCVDWNHYIELANDAKRIESDAMKMGYESSSDMYVKTLKQIHADLNNPEGSVCSKVKLQISQTMVMTRQAFRGTLSVFNGCADTPISNFSLILDIRDKDGNVATSQKFQTNLENLTGFSGENSLDGPWTLDPKKDGVAQILFIPTRYAAETEPEDYTFSGVIHYTDPYTGLDVTRSLSSVTLTVNPSPVLDLKYFMQRDVYGDDPFTETIEQSIPGEFALILDNVGYGDATNLRITTEQPRIIENEKGLLVDFELVSSQLDGEDRVLSLGKSITSDFGTIPARSSAYAQWWLRCSLAGFFDDYNVNVNHVTSYGNEDLSLIGNAEIHELIHGFSINDVSGKRVRGFLSNDVKDSEYMPDIVHFSDGRESGSVTAAADVSIVAESDNAYVVSVSPALNGWTYGKITDPTSGRKSLVSVTRLSDGADIPVDNFWQTPYILRKNEKPSHIRMLHMVADLSAKESFRLEFDPKPDMELAVEAFGGVPGNDETTDKPVRTVNVIFNKEIDPATFTNEDITLYNQGTKLDVSNSVVKSISRREFAIDFGDITSEYGLYVLTINTDGIKDTDGFTGNDGYSVSWIQDTVDGLSKTDVGKFNIYPLPMQNNVYVSGNFDSIDVMEFYDSNGILRQTNRDITPFQAIDVSTLLPDIYIVRILTETGIHIVKARKK